MSTERFPVVVGVDSTSSPDPAIAWAVDEAQSLHTDVLMLNGYASEYSVTAPKMYSPAPPLDRERAKHDAIKLVDTARDRAAELAPALTVRTAVSDSRGQLALLDASQRASCVVVGSRGLKAAGSFFLGSVSVAVAARADCPVVVVREQPAPTADDAVVVGVDRSDRASGVLAYAFDYAHRHGLHLKAVRCEPPELLADVVYGEPEPPDDDVAAWLDDRLTPWRTEYPDVPVEAAVVRDHAGPGLVAAAEGNRLLVVGTRGRGAIAGTLLGSVSQAALHNAACPVAVVPGR